MEGEMSESWTVSVAGRNYGPYSAAQMQAFAAEGRLAPHSLVSRAGDATVRAASEDPILAQLFEPTKPFVSTQATRNETPASTFGRHDQEMNKSGERSHFIIVSDMKSRPVQGLEEEIFNLGPAYALLPQVWVLSTEATINVVRNTLIQKLGKLDVLFVVDATNNKAAWFNFGPEPEARIRRVWQKASETTGRRAAG
jgi:hypothetical protein